MPIVVTLTAVPPVEPDAFPPLPSSVLILPEEFMLTEPEQYILNQAVFNIPVDVIVNEE